MRERILMTTDRATIMAEAIAHARKKRPWLVRPARVDFITKRPFRVTTYVSNANEINPDLAEAIAYSRAACEHGSVPFALTSDADQKAYGTGANIWEAFCADCQQLVLCDVGKDLGSRIPVADEAKP